MSNKTFIIELLIRELKITNIDEISSNQMFKILDLLQITFSDLRNLSNRNQNIMEYFDATIDILTEFSSKHETILISDLENLNRKLKNESKFLKIPNFIISGILTKRFVKLIEDILDARDIENISKTEAMQIMSLTESLSNKYIIDLDIEYHNNRLDKWSYEAQIKAFKLSLENINFFIENVHVIDRISLEHFIKYGKVKLS